MHRRGAVALCSLAALAGCKDDTKLEGAPVTLDVGTSVCNAWERQPGDGRWEKIAP